MTEHHDDQADRWLWVPSLGCVCIDDTHQLLWVVSPAGELWPIIADDTVRGTVFVPLGAEHTSQLAPHEAEGPLNPWWRSRVTRAPLLCGRPTRTTGRPCRATVTRPGAACSQHEVMTP
jgi:hypothetical protein